MTERTFFEAMGKINDKYVVEAMDIIYEQKIDKHKLLFRKRNFVACFVVFILVITLSLGITLAVNANFRQAFISFFFPKYTKVELIEIDEGHKTGSFDLTDTLFTFFEKFNAENIGNGVKVKKENGFEYKVVSQTENSVEILAECDVDNKSLFVKLERKPYKETTVIWQVVGYQITDKDIFDK